MKRNPKISAALTERQAESREICKKIRASTGRERMAAWEEKRTFGRGTRHLILAHAMTRKIPYLACEKKHREGNQPSAYELSAILSGLGFPASIEAIRAWLKGAEAETASVAA